MTNVVELRPVRTPSNRTKQAVMNDFVSAAASLRNLVDWFHHDRPDIAAIDATIAGLTRLCVEYRAADEPPPRCA